jgi:tRNA(adenine34) deaminase
MGINTTQTDQYFMQLALQQAELAAAADEVPVGAVVVCNGEVIAQAHNLTITQNNPSAHAEILALQQAGQALGNYRLIDCDLYVTLEPCGMCSVACVHARVKRLIYGASDLKTGAINSVEQSLLKPHHNHLVISVGGVLATECGQIISDFFTQKRAEKKLFRSTD